MLIENTAHTVGIARRGIEREAGAFFFGDLARTVVLGGELQVHAAHVSLARFILDAEVGHENLIAHNLEAMAGGDLGPGLAAEPSEILVECLLQFVIENDAEVPATLFEDFSCLFLIEPVEICIVVRFFRFDEAVVSRLTFGNKPVGTHQPVSGFGERHQLAGIGIWSLECSTSQEPLPGEIANVLLHPFPIVSIAVLGEVFRGNDAKLTETGQGVHLRRTQLVGAVPVVKHAAGAWRAGVLRKRIALALRVPVDVDGTTVWVSVLFLMSRLPRRRLSARATYG